MKFDGDMERRLASHVPPLTKMENISAGTDKVVG